MSRMVVTGGSGFVGGAVARAALAAGWSVTTTSRRPAEVAGAAHLVWDLDAAPSAQVVRVLGAADVVVHAGAYVGDGGARERVRRTTVGGTAAVRARTTGRLVLISSASVYDPRRPSIRAREEEAPVARYLDPYPEAKADAERLVLGAGSAEPAVVLRPHAVYGPGDTTLLPRVLGSVRRGRLPLPGGGYVLQHLTAVGTLVDATLAAATASLPGDVVVNVADAEPVLLREALTELLRRRSVQARVVAVPSGLATLAAVVGERLPHRGVPGSPRLTRYALSHLVHERTYDLTRLGEVLGVRPAVTTFVGAEDW